jgi:SNF2 family DNA or RNA helicase
MPDITVKTRADGTISVQSPWKYKDLCRSIPGGRWDADDRAWVYPATKMHGRMLRDAFLGQQVFTDAEFDALSAETPAPVDDREYPQPPLTKTKCWQHQCRGWHRLQTQPALMLSWNMGLGKSKAVVDGVVNLDARLTLITCPKSVVAVWPHEFSKHSAAPIRVVPLTADSVATKARHAQQAIDLAGARREALVLVCNHEAVWRSPLAELLLTTAWDLVVCDESQRIKSASGKASKYMERLGPKAKRRLCLTGTPMPHSPLDVFGQFRFLDPTIFGRSFTAFRHRYAVMGGYRPPGAKTGVEVLGYQNLDELQERFYAVADRVMKRDVLDLPPVTHQMRYVDLGPESARAYRDLACELVTQVEAGLVTASNALSKLLRLQQVTSGFLRTDSVDGGPQQDVPLGTEKAAALAEFLEDVPGAEPVVVFARFRHDLDTIAATAREAKRTCHELSGRVNQLAEWQQTAEPGCVLAVQIQAGGVGIDLTRASYACYYSLGFNNGDYQQSLARLDRPGQKQSVTYVHLVARATIDERVYSALQTRQDVVANVLDSLTTQEPQTCQTVTQ